jgi:hypothetical protein
MSKNSEVADAEGASSSSKEANISQKLELNQEGAGYAMKAGFESSERSSARFLKAFFLKLRKFLHYVFHKYI